MKNLIYKLNNYLILLCLVSCSSVPKSVASSVNQASFKELRVDQDLEEYDSHIENQRKTFNQTPFDIENKEWVKKKLKFMVEIDQYMRGKINLPHENNYSESETKYFWKEFLKRFRKMDEINTNDLKLILKKYSWIKISVFGKQADKDAWLIVQHADKNPKFQKEILKVLDSLWKLKETNASNYAYLFDRVAASFSDLSKQRPQRYGTQGMCKGPGKWEPTPIEDPDNVDKRRAEVGLGPMSEYKDRFKDICK